MSSPDETPPTSTADTSRRRGRIIAVAVGLVAVAAVVLALVLTGRGDDSPGAGGSPEPSAGSSSSSSTAGDEDDGTASAEPTDGPADELPAAGPDTPEAPPVAFDESPMVLTGVTARVKSVDGGRRRRHPARRGRGPGSPGGARADQRLRHGDRPLDHRRQPRLRSRPHPRQHVLHRDFFVRRLTGHREFSHRLLRLRGPDRRAGRAPAHSGLRGRRAGRGLRGRRLLTSWPQNGGHCPPLWGPYSHYAAGTRIPRAPPMPDTSAGHPTRMRHPHGHIRLVAPSPHGDRSLRPPFSSRP